MPGWGYVALALLSLARFAALGEWSLWIDEAHTLHDALALGRGEWSDFPLGLAVALASIQLRGGAMDELTLRLAPACFGALGIWLSLWAFRSVLGARRAAVAAILLGLSTWHLYWSQSARAYTLAQDVALVGSALALRGCFRPSRFVFAAGVVCTALAAFAHPSALLLALALIVAPVAAARSGRGPRWSPSPRAAVALGLFLAVGFGSWAIAVWSEYAERKAGASALHFLATSGYYAGPLGACALVATTAAWRRRDPFAVLAAGVCASVGIGALAASAAVTVSAQYVFVALPWACALVGGWLGDRGASRVARAVAALALIGYGTVDQTLYFTVRHGDRPRWREAYELVARERRGDDLVLGMAAPVGQYYLAPGSTDLRATRALVRLNAYSARVPAQWSRRERRTWFVVNVEDLSSWSIPARGDVERILAEECRPYAAFRVPWTPRDLDVLVYLRE